jgi:type VI secretion system protein ImpG
MDPRLLRYYNQELRYLREMGAEFATEFPKIASRLGMDTLEVADPYIERLLEGCAFLAARVQLKQDAEFPRLSHRLLELLYPNLLAPLPAMMVAQIEPVRGDANLLRAPRIARNTPLVAAPPAHTKTRCEFRTAQELQLTPLATDSAEYFLNLAELNLGAFALPERPRCGVRVRLKLPAGMSLAKLETDELRFFLGGQPDVAKHLHELLTTSLVGVLVGAPGRNEPRRLVAADRVQPVGFDDADAMLPVQLRMMSGLRLLQEYFAFPPRFLFFDVAGLRPLLATLQGTELELQFLFSKPNAALDGVVEPSNFSLHCVAAINLFHKRADRIVVDDAHHEFHVVPERTAPLDYEVFDVLAASGFDEEGQRAPLPAAVRPRPSARRCTQRLLQHLARAAAAVRAGAARRSALGLRRLGGVPVAGRSGRRADSAFAAPARRGRRAAPTAICRLFLLVGSTASPFTLEAGIPVAGAYAVAGRRAPTARCARAVSPGG